MQAKISIEYYQSEVSEVIFMDLKLWRWIHYGHNLDLIVYYWVFRSDASRKS